MKLDLETSASAINQWMKCPEPKPPLDAQLADMLLRAKQADQFMRDEPSSRKVVQQMLVLYKDRVKGYSEGRARDDIRLAERLFRSTTAHTPSYMRGIQLDLLLEAQIGAAHDRNWAAVARLAKEVRELLKEIEGEDTDRETLRRPITKMLVFDPEILGVERNPQLQERIRIELEKKKLKDPVARFRDRASDADFTEEHGA